MDLFSEWWLTFLAIVITRIFIGIPLVTTLFSIPTFKTKKNSFKIIITIITLNFLLFSTIVIPLAKIASIIEEKHKKKKEIEKAINTGANIELVYCPECGKAYAKGEEPCMCKCGYFFNK